MLTVLAVVSFPQYYLQTFGLAAVLLFSALIHLFVGGYSCGAYRHQQNPQSTEFLKTLMHPKGLQRFFEKTSCGICRMSFPLARTPLMRLYQCDFLNQCKEA